MPEYVYALHDFQPEHEDEIAFKAGERIEIIERDDLYNDGWWQGKNLEGKAGLFPQSYTTPAPPPTNPLIDNIPTTSPPPSTSLSVLPTHLQTLEEESESASTNGADSPDRIMNAAMTDVQRAIEQLGKGIDDRDERRSFSFASTKDGETTDDERIEGDGWHKGARQKLAQVLAEGGLAPPVDSEAELEQERRLEIERRLKPPIEAELSEESEGEEDERPSSSSRAHKKPSRLKSDTKDESNDNQLTPTPLLHTLHTPTLPSEADSPPTATQGSFIDLGTPTSSNFPPGTVDSAPKSAQHVRNASGTAASVLTTVSSRTATDTPATSVLRLSTSVTTVTNELNLPSPLTSKDGSAQSISSEPNGNRTNVNPMEWSVVQVVDWLKSKGFDQDVCDKFTEQEITGDVLIELDVNVLKSEIGIAAFGKRMRIANAILELRRPQSASYSDPPPTATMVAPSAVNTPLYVTPSPMAVSAPGVPTSFGPDSPLAASMSSAAMSFSTTSNGTDDTPTLGLTLPNTSPIGFPHMAQLPTSSSDGNLISRLVPRRREDSNEEEKGVLSEGEPSHQSNGMRLRLFGRSDTSSSKEKEREKRLSGSSSKRDSGEKDFSKQPATVGVRHARSKRSLDVAKSSDRLSLFGGVLMTASLGKGRKPPPRYSGSVESEPHTEKEWPSISLGRLYGSGSRKSNARTVNGSSPKLSEETTDSGTVLGEPSRALSKNRASLGAGQLKPDQSVLEQIGTPDHAGWMRKKGERYNNWKYRYFVLKSAHLYCMRSDNRNETRIKGYINLAGYKVIADENLDPGRYGFKIVHEADKPHYFSSDEQSIIREWMKAIMKTSIERDYSRVVLSSCNVPTIPLVVAQAMNPSPRPPSPTARAATQKAMRRENPNQLSTRDARVLMGLPQPDGAPPAPYNNAIAAPSGPRAIPQRPPRERKPAHLEPETEEPIDDELMLWANSHLPQALQFNDAAACTGLVLLRLAEAIKGHASVPPVADSAFPSGPNDDKLDGLFRLFDFLLDNDVKMGSVSINDVRQCKRGKIVQLLQALRAWEDHKQAVSTSFGQSPSSPLIGSVW